MPRARTTTINRKVHFYRISSAIANGRVTFPDLVSAIQQIGNLPWNANGRYLDIGDGNSVCMWPDLQTPQIKLRLGTRRTTGLPDMEDRGNLSPLAIAANASLSELTHMIIFPDLVLGAEFNFYGPRVPRLRYYLHSKTKLVNNPIKIQMLLQRDIENKLNDISSISLLKLRYRRSDAALIEEMTEGGLSGTFATVSAADDASIIELTLRNEIRSREPLSRRIYTAMRRMAGDTRSREVFDTFQIKGFNEETGRTEVVDLLKDFLISSQTVTRQSEKQRNINSDSMYNAINQAYRELRDDIANAPVLE